MKNTFLQRCLTIGSFALATASFGTAQAAPIIIGFNTINGACGYSESGFNFQCSGNHTDASEELYFHDNGANPGDTNVTVTFGGKEFSLISLDLVAVYNALTITDNLGHTISFANGSTGNRNIGFANITSAIFSTAGSSGAILDNLMVDNSPSAVPEPTTLALLGLGLLGFAASRRKAAK